MRQIDKQSYAFTWKYPKTQAEGKVSFRMNIDKAIKLFERTHPSVDEYCIHVKRSACEHIK
jgi:hypothetical protein